jgi:hypothetical protein
MLLSGYVHDNALIRVCTEYEGDYSYQGMKVLNMRTILLSGYEGIGDEGQFSYQDTKVHKMRGSTTILPGYGGTKYEGQYFYQGMTVHNMKQDKRGRRYKL